MVLLHYFSWSHPLRNNLGIKSQNLGDSNMFYCKMIILTLENVDVHMLPAILKGGCMDQQTRTDHLEGTLDR